MRITIRRKFKTGRYCGGSEQNKLGSVGRGTTSTRTNAIGNFSEVSRGAPVGRCDNPRAAFPKRLRETHTPVLSRESRTISVPYGGSFAGLLKIRAYLCFRPDRVHSRFIARFILLFVRRRTKTTRTNGAVFGRFGRGNGRPRGKTRRSSSRSIWEVPVSSLISEFGSRPLRLVPGLGLRSALE